jgi:hypothetical protein
MALLLAMSSFASSSPVERLDKQTIKAMDESQMQARYEILEARVIEIQALNLKTLERAERKAVKNELRYINKEMKALGNGGIYISTTALVIIILLLIIF